MYPSNHKKFHPIRTSHLLSGDNVAIENPSQRAGDSRSISITSKESTYFHVINSNCTPSNECRAGFFDCANVHVRRSRLEHHLLDFAAKMVPAFTVTGTENTKATLCT